MTFVRSVASGLLAVAALSAQGPGILPLNTSYQRVLAIVPMVGKGTSEDPIRPMFVPAGGFEQNRVANNGANQGRKARAGIISYAYQLSDDGKNAIVEFVSVDKEGLRPILESKLGNVTVFERDKAKKADIETAARAKKKDFDFGKFEHKVR